MANWAIFNTSIGQQFAGNNKKTNTLINVNDWNPIDTEVTPEATPKQRAEATPQYRLNKEKVLDDQLRNKGLTVTATSKADQDKYWKWLSKEMQDQMKQFHEDWYSFDGARTLLEQIYGKKPQSLKVKRAGEAKWSDTWIWAVQDSIPMKIADWINLPWKGTEYLMKYEQQISQWIQNWINEKIWVNEWSTAFRDRANKNLKEKIDNLPEEKVKELTDKFNENSARWQRIRWIYWTVENYIEERTKNRWEWLLNIGTYESDAKMLPWNSKFENFVNKYGFQWDVWIEWDRILANTPRSAIDLATASLYAKTNSVDNLADLAYLFTTKEGLDIVKEQYWSLEDIQETFVSDPYWFLSDFFDAKDLISRAKSRQKKAQWALNQSKVNAKKNEILKLASDIAKEQQANEWKNTINTLDNIWKLDKLTEEKTKLEEKGKELDESQKKWEERAEQASTLSDFFIDTEPMNKAIINYLSDKWWIGKSIAYWYSLTQNPLSTIWNGVATEKQIEQNKPQTLDDLDEGKEPEKETITVTDKITPGIADSKAVQNVGEVWKRIRDKWEERTTGLTPDMKARIQQNPYVKAYWDQIKATIEDEWLSNQEQIIEEQFLEEIGNELLARIENEENRVEETGVMYNKIRDLPQTFDFTSTAPGIVNTFDKAWITIRPDGTLFFRNWSEAMTTDRSHAQILWNLMMKFMNGQALTASEFLDLRSQFKAIENYKKWMDPTSAGKSAMLARQLRTEVNKLAHKEIPWLKEIDSQYHEQISYLQQLKKDITYAQWPNSWKVRSNFYSIIRNINSANRKQYAGIIAWIFPEIKDRVEAVRLMPKLIKAYQKNSWLLQSVVNMPKLLSAAQLASWDGFIKSAMTLLIGQFVEEGLIRPVDKKLRQATIDEVINELDPVAKLKLEEAIKNAQDWEKLSKEEQIILQEVTKKITQSIEEYRENLPKLPEPEADVIDEQGNVTLGRGQPNTPEPQRRNIIEINLYKPEAKQQEIAKIQEENNVDQQTAEKIDNTLQAFLEEMWATNWNVNVEEIDYNNFSTPTLNELRVSDRIPQIEKDKIENILKNRLEYSNEWEWQEMDKYFAVKIDNLNEEEQRIGKVGKNKVNKAVAKQQEGNRAKKRERLIKEIEQFYFDWDPDSAMKAEDKFKELEATPRDVIDSYKKSQNYIYESAERELLNRYLKEWDKQPKFTKSMTQKQLENRAEILASIKPQNWYEMETTDYNDRYVLKNGNEIIDRGAIKYNGDWTVEVIVQDINWFMESWLLETLPSDVVVRVSNTEDTATVWELRWERFQFEQNNLNKEKNISREEWINQKNVINNKSVGELAKWYWVNIEGADEIKVSALIKAYGKYKDWIITLAKTIKESTAPHELLHAVFDIVEEGRKKDILQRIMDSEGVDKISAEEILANNFSQYFRTWEFDNYIAPKTFIDKIKSFFKKVKQFITGVYDNQTVMKKLFDDIIEGKIENTWFTDRIRYDATTRSSWRQSLNPLRNQVSRIRVRWRNSSPEATFSSNTQKIKIWSKTYVKDLNWARFTNNYKFPVSQRNQKFLDNFNNWITNWDSRVVIWEYDGYALMFPLNDNFWYHFREHWAFDPENLIATVNDFDTLKVNPQNGRYVFEKQLPNGNRLRVISTQNFKELSFYESKTPWSWWPIIDRDWWSKYQIAQESLFDENTNKEQLRRKWMELIEKYRWKVIADVVSKYDPDIVEWKNNVKSQATLSQLYELKNIAEDLIKNDTDRTVLKNVEERISSPSMILQDLIDRVNKWKHQKVSTYDNKQITKIGEELGSQLVRFNQDTIDVLWDLYNPDVDKWQSNINQVRRIREKYADIRLPHTSRLTNLKSKLKELSNYTPEQIKEVFWEDDQASKNLYKFVNDARNKELELEAKWATEAVTQLVALHNMDYKNLEKQIKNFDGKTPMPSIAVMDPNVPHEVFGDLTLVFWRDTIDPKVNPENKVYGSDAWTPMFPEIKEVWTLSTYAKRHQAIMEIIRPNKEWLESKWVKRPENFRFDFNQATEECLKDYIWRKDLNKNAEMLSEQIMEDIAVELEHSKAEFLEWDIELYERLEDWFFKMFTKASTAEYVIPAKYFRNNPITLSKEDSNKLANELTETLMKTDYAKKWLTEKQMKNWMYELVDNLNDNEWDDRAKYVWQRIKNIWIELDTTETLKIMGDINKYAKVILQDSWTIKDRPLTPENVLEAMRNQENNRTVKPGSFRDMIEIEWHELNDVEDIRKQNFAKVFHGDRTGDLWDLEKRYDNLVNVINESTSQEQIINRTLANRIIEKFNTQELVQKYDWDLNKEAQDLSKVLEKIDRTDRMWALKELTKFWIRTPEDSPIGWILDLINDVDGAKSPTFTAIKDSYSTDVNKFNENMKKQGYPDIPNDVLQRLIEVVEQGKKIPIRFSESKPERVVDLYNEVRYILVPEEYTSRAKELVRGTPLEWKLVEYTPDNKTAPRSRKLKELQKKYGNVFFTMWGTVMPIAMLLKMAETLWGGDDDDKNQMVA